MQFQFRGWLFRNHPQWITLQFCKVFEKKRFFLFQNIHFGPNRFQKIWIWLKIARIFLFYYIRMIEKIMHVVADVWKAGRKLIRLTSILNHPIIYGIHAEWCKQKENDQFFFYLLASCSLRPKIFEIKEYLAFVWCNGPLLRRLCTCYLRAQSHVHVPLFCVLCTLLTLHVVLRKIEIYRVRKIRLQFKHDNFVVPSYRKFGASVNRVWQLSNI